MLLFTSASSLSRTEKFKVCRFLEEEEEEEAGDEEERGPWD